MLIQVLDQSAKRQIQAMFTALEERLKIDGIADVLITAVFELVENAVKANLKRAFFIRQGFDLEVVEEYQTGIAAFKASYRDLHRTDYLSALRDLALAVGSEKLWKIFCPAIGRPDLTDDPRFKTNQQRAQNRDALIDILQQVFLTRSFEDWEQVLLKVGVRVRFERGELRAFNPVAPQLVHRLRHRRHGERQGVAEGAGRLLHRQQQVRRRDDGRDDGAAQEGRVQAEAHDHPPALGRRGNVDDDDARAGREVQGRRIRAQ